MSQNLFAYVAKYLVGGGAAPLNVDASGNLLVAQAAQPEISSEQVFATSGNVANAAAVATLAAAAAKTTYISGFSMTFSGATAASVVTATITGLKGATFTAVISVPAGATVGGSTLSHSFSPPLPASAANTAIVVTLPALGTGNTNAATNAWGYQQ